MMKFIFGREGLDCDGPRWKNNRIQGRLLYVFLPAFVSTEQSDTSPVSPVKDLTNFELLLHNSIKHISLHRANDIE